MALMRYTGVPRPKLLRAPSFGMCFLFSSFFLCKAWFCYEEAIIWIRSGGVRRRFLAALIVFFMSMATVMGPTPPGTGVI